MTETIDWTLPTTINHFWRRGWGSYPVHCDACGLSMIAVVRIGTIVALTCPCGHTHPPKLWQSDTGQPGDGVWL
jgi:hypothetical protein